MKKTFLRTDPVAWAICQRKPGLVTHVFNTYPILKQRSEFIDFGPLLRQACMADRHDVIDDLLLYDLYYSHAEIGQIIRDTSLKVIERIRRKRPELLSAADPAGTPLVFWLKTKEKFDYFISLPEVRWKKLGSERHDYLTHLVIEEDDPSPIYLPALCSGKFDVDAAMVAAVEQEKTYFLELIFCHLYTQGQDLQQRLVQLGCLILQDREDAMAAWFQYFSHDLHATILRRMGEGIKLLSEERVAEFFSLVIFHCDGLLDLKPQPTPQKP